MTQILREESSEPSPKASSSGNVKNEKVVKRAIIGMSVVLRSDEFKPDERPTFSVLASD